MIRPVTRPSTARCTLPMYIAFLLSEPNSVSCLRVSDVLDMSHDSVNRFLYRETYSPEDLFAEARKSLDLIGGILSVDDTVLDKPYAKYLSFLGHFWSGKHHAVVRGINLITLYYTDPKGQQSPINFRIYDKSEKKTKNDYFLEMLEEVMAWGLSPSAVTGDSWYSCVPNLKAVKKHGLGMMFGIEANRLVSVEKGTWLQVQKLDIPEDGLLVWLKDFGHVKVFRTLLKNQKRHYVTSIPEDDSSNDKAQHTKALNYVDFKNWHDAHWHIEQYHRAIKQVCNIESFQVRGKAAIKTHVFAAICGYVELQKMRAIDLIKNCYAIQKDLFKSVIASFVNKFAPTMEGLCPSFSPSVNA